MTTFYGFNLSNANGAAQPWREVRAIYTLLLFLLGMAATLTVGTSASIADVTAVTIRFLAASLSLGALLCLATSYLQRRHPFSIPFDRSRAMALLLTALVVGMTIPVFGVFKQLVLPLRGFPLDPLLRTIDRALFLGTDPWRLTHALLPWTGATQVMDRLYTLWMPMMFAFPMLAIIAGRTPLDRMRLVCCWFAAWLLIGGFGAWLLGSAGPCYYNALVGADPGFADLSARLQEQAIAARTTGSPIAAIEFQSMLLEAFKAGGYAPAGGISAAPSMHVAMAILFAIGGFRINRWLGVGLALFAAAIWVASVHLGWHYAMDGVISALAMLVIWPASGAVARWLLSRTGLTSKSAVPRAECASFSSAAPPAALAARNPPPSR